MSQIGPMSRSVYLSLQELQRQKELERELKKREKELKQLELQSLQSTSVDPIEEIAFEQFREIDRATKKALDPSPQSIPNRRLTITQLKNDTEFADTAERFMDVIGRNENIFEYLRDANFSLSAAAQRSREMGEWDEQTMEDYNYLRTRFNNAEIGSFKERLGLIKDLGGDILLDPMNWLTGLFAIPSGGGAFGLAATSKAAQAKGLAQLAKQGSKRYTKSKFESDVKREAGKRFGLLGAGEGLAWGGLHDYFMQEIDVNLGLQDEIDLNRVAISSTLGATLGGAVGAGIGRFSVGSKYSNFLDKEYKFAREGNVDVYVGRHTDEVPVYNVGDEQPEPVQQELFDDVKQPTPKKKKKEINPRQEEINDYNQQQQVDEIVEETYFKGKIPDFSSFLPTKFNNAVAWLSKKLIEKPTAEFMRKVNKIGKEKTPILMNNLRKLRMDVDKGVLKGGLGVKQISLDKSYANPLDQQEVSNLTTQSYGQYYGELFGTFYSGLEQVFSVLGKTGVFKHTLNSNDNLRTLMQNKDIQLVREKAIDTQGNTYGYSGKEKIMARVRDERTGKRTFSKELKVGDEHNGIVLDRELHFGYRRLRGLYDDVYDLSIEEGLLDPSVSKLGYFPRIFNYQAVLKDRAILEKRIIEAGHANPDNTKMPQTDFVDETGTPIDVTLFFKARDANYDSFEDVAARQYYLQFDKKQRQAFTNKKEVKEFLKENELPKSQAHKYFIPKIKKGTDLKINFKKIKNAERNDIVDAYSFAKEKKAETIVDDMLAKRHIPHELKTMGARYGESSGFLQQRVFVNIKDEDIQQFLEGDVMQVSNQYFNNAAQILSRSKYYGKNVSVQEKNVFEPIKKELEEAGLSTDEAVEIVNNFRRVVRRVTGLDTSHLDSWWIRTSTGRNLGDILKLSQQMAHLPLATLSSITEPMILLSRDFSSDTTKDIGSALVSETGNMFDRIGKSIRRVKGEKTASQKLSRLGVKEVDGEFFNVGRFSDDEWFELYQTGLALEQTVMERIEGLAGEALNGRVFKGFQNAFFKSNLLTQWTRAVQLASFTTGKRIIRQHARYLATNKTDLGGTLSAGKKQQIIDELNEFSIGAEEAIEWFNNSTLPNGKIDENLARGLTNDGKISMTKKGLSNAKFNKKLIQGANRFTKEIILNPSIAEANRPLWFSNPSAQLLMQFAGYPTVFTNTVLKRFAREIAKDGSRKEMYRTGRILPTALLMTSVAHIGNELRSNGKATFEYGTDEKKPTWKIIKDAVRRWGGLGPFDYADRFANERERGTGFVAEGLKSFTGPIPQDVVDAILYRKGLAEIAVTNAPYFQLYDSIFGEGTRKKLKQLARGSKGREKKTSDLFARRGYDRGGIVKNVPNVKDEPDERVDKRTGQMYNSTSESAQDLSDRELKGQIKGLGLK